MPVCRTCSGKGPGRPSLGVCWSKPLSREERYPPEKGQLSVQLIKTRPEGANDHSYQAIYTPVLHESLIECRDRRKEDNSYAGNMLVSAYEQVQESLPLTTMLAFSHS